MSLYRLEALPPSPETSETLSILAQALGDKRVSPPRRVPASENGRSPDEGLAVLAGYVAIADTRVRQALLDTILAIAGIDPHQ